MTFLSEDPTYLAGFFLLVAAACLTTLKITQQGKYLVWGMTSLGLALAVVVIERLWVTDNERIENVVYELRRAVLEVKPDEVLSYLTPDVEYIHDGSVISGDATRELIRANLANSSFDFVHIQDLQTSAGRQTRRGKAEFRVYAKGTLRTPLATYNTGTANSTWSLGFQETEPGVWKVNRITPVSMLDGMALTAPSRSASKANRGEQGKPGPRPYGSYGPSRGSLKRPYGDRNRNRTSATSPLSSDERSDSPR